nr:transposase [Amycolatopsis panacis]
MVYNDALRTRQDAYKAEEKISDTDVQKRVVTEAKRTPERAWLSDVASVVLVQACQDARAAYRNWFDSMSGTRKGRRVGRPRFRSRKDNRQTIRLTRNGFSVKPNGKLYAAKIGDLRITWSRELPSAPSSVTLIKDAAGRYFASFVVGVDHEPLPETGTDVGIDLGLSTFAVLSNGKTIESPKFLRRAERKLRTAQQALSRKAKGSNNRAKARLRVAKAHAKVRDARTDWAHKNTTALIRDNQAVYVEDLAVSGLARTRLAKSVYDAAWATFLRMLEDKAQRYGRVVRKIDRFYPSSQICSECGRVDGPKPLSVREWSCPCGAHHDRDLNAAKNILAAGRAERLNACGETVSLSAWRGARLVEPGTHRGDLSARSPRRRRGRNPGRSRPGGRQNRAAVTAGVGGQLEFRGQVRRFPDHVPQVVEADRRYPRPCRTQIERYQRFRQLVPRSDRVDHGHGDTVGEVSMNRAHASASEHDRFRALTHQACPFERDPLDHFLAAGVHPGHQAVLRDHPGQFGVLGDMTNRHAAVAQAVVGQQPLIERPGGGRPHREDRETRTKPGRELHGRLARSDHRNLGRLPQKVQPVIRDRVDEHGVEAGFLSTHTGFEVGEIHQPAVGFGQENGGHQGRDDLGGESVPDDGARNLVVPVPFGADGVQVGDTHL